ncbi:ABC transporter [Pseudomonas fluorescens]|nr:ABC transporter [Pseudomonas fluorescens]OZO47009.1 ABC transporter [Pseudomonas fluorescens]TGY16811.1 ABC transporter [Pseudomonas fluorescens]
MRSTLRTGLTLVVIFLLFLALNLVWTAKLPELRWDFTQHQIHTLSPPTQNLLMSLEAPLDLYYFNAHNNPKRTHALNRYGKRIEDLLREYEKTAKGMINLHLIEPAPFSEDAYKAALYGLDDQTGFLGLIGNRAGHGAQRIGAFSLDREPLLEYEINHLIYQLQHPEPRTIGLLSGLNMGESAGRLMGELQRHFDLINLEPALEQVPASIKTLMVVQPRALPYRTLYAIEQFTLRGGRLLMFIDPISEHGAGALPANSRLDEMLTAWGIQVFPDKLLIDHLYASSVITGAGKPAVRHPARLNLPREAMSSSDISSWKLNTVTVSSSGALSPRTKSRTTFTPLLQSSWQSALLETDRFASALKFDALSDEISPHVQRHTLAARIEGPAYSAFPNGIKGQPPGLQKAERIHVVVVADTDLLMDEVANTAPGGNAQFILNTLDNLSVPDPLASLRPRMVTNNPPRALHTMRDKAAQAYREKATELERRLQRTEQEWQLLTPPANSLGTQAVDPNIQLQALNKERLRLPMELHALKAQTYKPVHRLELMIKLGLIAAVPLTLCLIAWAVWLRQQHRRSQPYSLLY